MLSGYRQPALSSPNASTLAAGYRGMMGNKRSATVDTLPFAARATKQIERVTSDLGRTGVWCWQRLLPVRKGGVMCPSRQGGENTVAGYVHNSVQVSAFKLVLIVIGLTSSIMLVSYLAVSIYAAACMG